MQSERKIFAFKLADEKTTTESKPLRWQARNGVAVAGCTDQTGEGDYRSDHDAWGNYRGTDNGQWC
jgi:hypothetical protein